MDRNDYIRSSVRRCKHNEQKSRLVHLYRDRSIYFINDSKRYFAFDRISFHTTIIVSNFFRCVRWFGVETARAKASERASKFLLLLDPRTSEITIAVNGGVGVFRFVRSIPFPARNTRTRISHTPFLATIMQRDRDRCGSTCCATTLSSLFAPSVEQLITTKSKDTRQGRRRRCVVLDVATRPRIRDPLSFYPLSSTVAPLLPPFLSSSVCFV